MADDARIRRLFDSAKIAPEFAVRKTDALEFIAEMARMRRMPPMALALATRDAEVRYLTGVRAEAQAPFLAMYRALRLRAQFAAPASARPKAPTRSLKTPSHTRRR